MEYFAEKYINPFTDYGFKKLFGEEPNKDLLLDFVFDEDKNDPQKFRYDVKLSDIKTKEIFYDKLTFIYLEMPKFNKTLDELETRFDKWLFVLRNLTKLDRIPSKLQEKIFEQLFETAEIAKFTPAQVRSYENSLKYYRDLKNSLDTAREEGREEGVEEGIEKGIEQGLQQGIEKGIEKVARNALKMGKSFSEIMELTGLTKEQIEKLE